MSGFVGGLVVEDVFIGGSFEGQFGGAKWQLGGGRVNLMVMPGKFARSQVAVKRTTPSQLLKFLSLS